MSRLLVVIDYQNDFVNGALGFAKAETLEKRRCSFWQSLFPAVGAGRSRRLRGRQIWWSVRIWSFRFMSRW